MIRGNNINKFLRRCSDHRDQLLVTAKLPSNSANPHLPCGSFRCGKNCATCPYILTDLLHIPSFYRGNLPHKI